MSKVVFDIETVGMAFDDLDTMQQEYLLRNCESEEDAQREKDSTGLSALTGFVCCVALFNPDTCQGKVYALGSLPTSQRDGVGFEYLDSEADLLTAFWKTVKQYDQAISFNGRGFDVPFLMLRSAIHKIRPTKNLMGYRYESSKHCDLAEQLSFYGATRRYPLHFYLKAFGIPTSKGGAVEGKDVTVAFGAGRIEEIATYCLKDVLATADLYRVWNDHLNVGG